MHVFNIRLFVFNDEDKEVDVEDMHVEDTRMFEELLMETCLTILRCVAVCYSVLQFNTQHISKHKSTHGDMFDDLFLLQAGITLTSPRTRCANCTECGVSRWVENERERE